MHCSASRDAIDQPGQGAKIPALALQQFYFHQNCAGMFQNCANCISASKKCNSCWVRLRGSAGWYTIFCCTILHTRLALDCTWCAIAIARNRLAINYTRCRITSLQTADLHTIGPDYCSDACNWCATAAAEHHRHCRNFALLYLRHTERCATEVQSWTKCGTRSCEKVHWNCTKVLQHCKNAHWELLQIYSSCPHSPASCRDILDASAGLCRTVQQKVQIIFQLAMLGNISCQSTFYFFLLTQSQP